MSEDQAKLLVKSIDTLVRSRISQSLFESDGNATKAAQFAERAAEAKQALKKLLAALSPRPQPIPQPTAEAAERGAQNLGDAAQPHIPGGYGPNKIIKSI